MDFPSFEKTLAEFKKKAIEFRTAYEFLTTNSTRFDNDPALKAEKNRLLASGTTIKTSIEAATKAVDKVNSLYNEFKDFIGLGSLGNPLLIPAAAVAVITGSITAITYWLTSFARLKTQMYEELVATGSTPQQATALMSTVEAPPSVLGNGFKPLLGLAVAGLILWYVTNE